MYNFVVSTVPTNDRVTSLCASMSVGKVTRWVYRRDLEKWRPCLSLNVLIALDVVCKNQLFNMKNFVSINFNYTSRFNEVERGVYWFYLVRLSICLSVDRIVSTLYLQQYSSDPFHICTPYQATSECVSSVKFVSKIWNFDFVFFWLGIQYDSIVWIIMRWQGGILRTKAF